MLEERLSFRSTKGNSTTVSTFVHRNHSDKYKNWVLGTVGSGIVICEGMCSDEEIENGSIFRYLARHVLGSTLLNPDCLTWYRYSNGDYTQTERQTYYDYLSANPEAVFLTIHEISAPYHFIRLNLNMDASEKKESQVTSLDTIERLSQYVRNKKHVGSDLQTENEDGKAVKYIVKKGFEVEDILLETDFGNPEVSKDSELSSQCVYYRIYTKDETGNTSVLLGNTYFYDPKLLGDRTGLEESVVKLIALRCANLMMPDKFRDSNWRLDDENKNTRVRIRKRAADSTSLEIMIYRPRKYRNEFLSV